MERVADDKTLLEVEVSNLKAEIVRIKHDGAFLAATVKEMVTNSGRIGKPRALIPPGTFMLDPMCHFSSVVVISACARRPGAAACVERRRRERWALLAVRGSRSDTRAASQASERMHHTLSHWVKT